MPTFQVGIQPVQILSAGDLPGVIYNRSTTIQVNWGLTASEAARSDASILDLNATIAVDGTQDIWVVAASGSVIVDYMPSANAYFRALTAAFGALSIPSVFSPNFVHLISGWSINEDGSAEFNNLTIRGTFFGLDFIINSQGAFFYNGVPALGNLKISIVSNGGGIDQFGNVYLDNITAYNVAVAGGGYAQLAANPVTGLPFLVLKPPGGTHTSDPPQIGSGIVNPGAVNELTQIFMNSGFETGTGGPGAAGVQAVSRSNDGTLPSFIVLTGDVTETVLVDGNTYRIGQKLYSAGSTPVAVTTPVTLLTIGPLATAGRYYIHGWALYIGNQAAGAPIFSWGGTGGLVLGGIQDGFQKFSGGGVAPIIHNNIGALGAVTGPAFAANTTNWLYEFDIYVTVTTGGSLIITGAENTAGDSFVVSRTYANLSPY